jgi:ketosteroid isomerase-like protein
MDPVELLERYYEARKSGDDAALDGLVAPDFEARTSPDNPDQIVERGREGLESFFARWASAWTEYVFQPHSFRTAGERVVVLGKAKATPRGGDVEIEQFVGHLWTIRDGRLASLAVFHDRFELLKAAGLD